MAGVLKGQHVVLRRSPRVTYPRPGWPGEGGKLSLSAFATERVNWKIKGKIR
jgi:hypothetical protein